MSDAFPDQIRFANVVVNTGCVGDSHLAVSIWVISIPVPLDETDGLTVELDDENFCLVIARDAGQIFRFQFTWR